ncbi:MAG: hypothetical protein ABI561_18285, partial [Bradyrhizobium sp.]
NGATQRDQAKIVFRRQAIQDLIHFGPLMVQKQHVIRLSGVTRQNLAAPMVNKGSNCRARRILRHRISVIVRRFCAASQVAGTRRNPCARAVSTRRFASITRNNPLATGQPAGLSGRPFLAERLARNRSGQRAQMFLK